MDSLFINTILPKQLTKEEINNLFNRFKQGDLSAREKIIVHNIRFVIYRVHKIFINTSYDKNELVSIGLIGLVKSVDTFDINKNVDFLTYATKCIDNEIKMFIRKGRKLSLNQSLWTPISKNQDGKTLIDILEDNNSIVDDYEDNITYQEIRNIIQELPDRDKTIIMLYFGFIDNRTYTQEEIAKKMNLDRSYISKLISKLVKQIGNQLKEKGIVERIGRVKK